MRDYPHTNGRLLIDGVDPHEIIKQAGTPVYIYEQRRIEANYRRLKAAFEKHVKSLRVHYAMKANSALAVLRILEKEGAFIDAVTWNEVQLAMLANFPVERIQFTGVNVDNESLEAASKLAPTITFDSVSQMDRMAKIRRTLSIAIRVTPEVGAGSHQKTITGHRGSKFGVPAADAVAAFLRAKQLGFNVVGIHAHIGSGWLEPEPFFEAAKVICGIAKKVEKEARIRFEFVDIGGGFGVSYRPEDKDLDVEAVGAGVSAIFNEHFGSSSTALAIEPGRYLVADAGYLLTRVTAIKDTPGGTFAGVDAGMNDLVRPAMYDAYHHIVPVHKMDLPFDKKFNIAGPVCETGDIFGHDRAMPKLQEGDVLAVLNAGAYGMTMASNYNSRGRGAEVLVWDGQMRLIRKRETLEDLARPQVVPDHLRQAGQFKDLTGEEPGIRMVR
jgi:diaminopimelate decarboxylase